MSTQITETVPGTTKKVPGIPSAKAKAKAEKKATTTKAAAKPGLAERMEKSLTTKKAEKKAAEPERETLHVNPTVEAKPVKDVTLPKRAVGKDAMENEDVAVFIRAALKEDATLTCAAIHKRLRAAGNSCSDQRFRSVFAATTKKAK